MRKAIVAVAAIGAAAFAARRHSNRAALAAVNQDLRTPILPFLPQVNGTRMLPVYRRFARIGSAPGDGVTVTDLRVGSPAVRVLSVKPIGDDELRPGLLWIHSGGLVVGSPQFELSVIGPMVRELGAVIVAPAYRLAPEHPFPAALDDCMAVLRWMRADADALGIDAARIAVAGGSAGGCLSAAVAQRSHDERIPLRAQALAYPMLDDRASLRDDYEGRGHFVWTPSVNRFGWTCYLGREPRIDSAPEYAVPARRNDLAGLPPAWVGVGELDLLYDEDVAYAARLTASGVPCELVTVPGMYHGADLFAAEAESMQAFRLSMMEHLRAHL